MRFPRLDRVAAGRLVDPDREQPAYTRLARRRDELSVVGLAETEMTVRIDHGSTVAPMAAGAYFSALNGGRAPPRPSGSAIAGRQP
jgi:hypothetical protein